MTRNLTAARAQSYYAMQHPALVASFSHRIGDDLPAPEPDICTPDDPEACYTCVALAYCSSAFNHESAYCREYEAVGPDLADDETQDIE